MYEVIFYLLGTHFVNISQPRVQFYVATTKYSPHKFPSRGAQEQVLQLYILQLH